jgi:adenosylmethionine-8-amino-7-oxononanoate aminotransferase
MKAQLDAMPHVMFGGLAHEPAFKLAARLSKMVPGNLPRVFFSDSGSVAVEVALKMALQYHLNRGDAQRTKFLAFRHAYHGDTVGAMSVTDPEDGMHKLFKDLVPRQYFFDVPQGAVRAAALDVFLARHGSELAGIILEPQVQGAGGMKFHDASAVANAARAAKKCGALFIADEIFTGFARTGQMFASPMAPDILCVGKALTGGAVGLAATLASQKVFDAFLDADEGRALMHGPTYMANPLACAAANASLDLFAHEDRPAQARAIEGWLAQGLAPARNLRGVVDVRTRGAIGVVQLEKPPDVARLRARFIEEGCWIRPFGDIVYLTPALTANEEEIAYLCAAICRVLA